MFGQPSLGVEGELSERVGFGSSGIFELSGGPVMALTTEGATRITPVRRLSPTAAAEVRGALFSCEFSISQSSAAFGQVKEGD